MNYSKLILLLFAFGISTCIIAQEEINENIHDKYTSVIYEVSGYKINVEEKGSGESIVFLAGGPGNAHDYLQGAFGHYYKNAHLVFYDALGRGNSEDARNKDEYTIENDVELLEALRVILKIDKWSIVGHSYGAVLAQAYTIKYPSVTNKIILINGFHSGEMWQANCDSYNHYAKTHFPEKWKMIDSLRSLGYVSSDPELSKVYGAFPTKYVYYHNTKLKQNSPNFKYRNWNNDVYVNMLGKDGDFYVGGSMIDQDYRKQLKYLSNPTLIIAGRYDGVSTPEYAVQYKHFMPQARFVMFENSGHNPYLEEPEKFYRLFEDFLNLK